VGSHLLHKIEAEERAGGGSGGSGGSAPASPRGSGGCRRIRGYQWLYDGTIWYRLADCLHNCVFSVIIYSYQRKMMMTLREFFDALAFAACIALPFVLYFYQMKP
jgi:hypothetical protein